MRSNAASISAFSELLDLIYSGATDIRKWDEIPRRISEWLGSSTCLIFTPQYSSDDGGFTAKHQLEMLDVYEAGYREKNIWEMNAVMRGFITTGAVMRDQDLVTEEEFLASPFYRDLLSKIDVGRLLAGVIFSPADNDGKLVVIAAHQPVGRPFSDAQANQLKMLMPHLSRALGVLLKLREAEISHANSLAVLDSLPGGALLVAADMSVTFVNAQASRILGRNQALRVGGKPQRRTLLAPDPGIQEKIDRALQSAIEPGLHSIRYFSEPVLIPRGADRAPLVLNVSSLGKGRELDSEKHAAVIVFINDPEQAAPPNENFLAEAYGLTPTEARVSALLLDGDSLKVIAGDLGVTENTVKSHVKAIYQKTNCSSRASFVKLMLSITG
jgi:DNA-binding CsgD family transcriptional regulator/PAS domain-containing protein